MPEKKDILFDILKENKNPVIEVAKKTYAKAIDDVLSFGEDIVETVSQIFTSHPDLKKDFDRNFIINKLEKQPGLPLSHLALALPEGKNAGTLESVTRQDIKVEAKDSNLFGNVSVSLKDLAPSLRFRNDAKDKFLCLYTGERFGVRYEQKDGYRNTYTKGIKADYNAFSGRVTVGGYYRAPNETVNVSVFRKKDNYGFSAGYSNEKGLDVRGAIDKKGAALNVRFDKEYKECFTSIGAFISTEYNTIGMAARMAF